MGMNNTEIAKRLQLAEKNRTPVEPLTQLFPQLKEADAYEIQRIQIAELTRLGHRVVGYKVGLTNRHVQEVFGVYEPDFGHLLENMVLDSGSTLLLESLIQPKIEAEIAFVLGKEVRGPGLTTTDLIRAVDYVVPALEIIDSRIIDWKIRGLDTIADNGSSARFVLGNRKTPLGGLDLSLLGVVLRRGSEVMSTGAGAAVLGNPLHALTFLANRLGALEKRLCEGDIVLSGAISHMFSLKSGELWSAEIRELGSVSVRCA